MFHNNFIVNNYMDKYKNMFIKSCNDKSIPYQMLANLQNEYYLSKGNNNKMNITTTYLYMKIRKILNKYSKRNEEKKNILKGKYCYNNGNFALLSYINKKHKHNKRYHQIKEKNGNNKETKYKFNLYIRMEYCKSTLENYINTRENMNINRNYEIIQMIILGLYSIHNNNIMHRDLKPSNIFISDNNIVKIGDFGLASYDYTYPKNRKRKKRKRKSSNLSYEYNIRKTNILNLQKNNTPFNIDKYNNNIIRKKKEILFKNCCTKNNIPTKEINRIGTKIYAAPEQLIGNKYTKAVDMFSLGLIIVDLFTITKTNMERMKILCNARHRILPDLLIKNHPQLKKLKKLLNKKIKFDINEKHKNGYKNTRYSFIYIHELTLIDYVDYVLNKSSEYDCILFYINVESSNNVSKLDRKTLILLEIFNEVARHIIFNNFVLYNESEDVLLLNKEIRNEDIETKYVNNNNNNNNNNIYETKDHNDKHKKNDFLLLKPVFFFYINFNKSHMNPIKHVHMIYNLPEFVYVHDKTFDNIDYQLIIDTKYMLEYYIKDIKKIDYNHTEINNKMLETYFKEFIYLHNKGNWNKINEKNPEEKEKVFITLLIIFLFLFLYLFVLILQKCNFLIFLCSYFLYFICLSGLFHCLINKSELYNTSKNLDSFFHKYIYRSTNSQYICEGFIFSFLILFITLLFFILLKFSSNIKEEDTSLLLHKSKKINILSLCILCVIFMSLKFIQDINLYKIYFSTYYFFPPLKFFRK
ncbi:PEK protein kinase [Plasmodium falciparum Palo Alto/Uganda]|uniref:PEK protein kinase n=1 Tax=Plasmodium falciparum (isolate Palo Alto / Uganda) TaxID=57270 RepID=W4J6K1_PLAFP|nr:PEK protein kinase [Plasmodium falciparum Palo Alto/Uganda]